MVAANRLVFQLLLNILFTSRNDWLSFAKVIY
jgi:hypothetical protein